MAASRHAEQRHSTARTHRCRRQIIIVPRQDRFARIAIKQRLLDHAGNGSLAMSRFFTRSLLSSGLLGNSFMFGRAIPLKQKTHNSITSVRTSH